MNKIEEAHFHVEGQEVEWPYQAHANITESISTQFAEWIANYNYDGVIEKTDGAIVWETERGEQHSASELFAEFVKTL